MARKSKRASKIDNSQKSMNLNNRAGLIFVGIVSLIFGWILWEGILTIEQAIAVVLYVFGVLKILWGLFNK